MSIDELQLTKASLFSDPIMYPPEKLPLLSSCKKRDFSRVDLFADEEADDTQECRVKRQKLSDAESIISSLRYIHEGLNLSSSLTGKLRKYRTESLLKEKKLILILDLDSTLLHTVQVKVLSPDEEYLMELQEDDPNNTSIFWWSDRVTKLRPFVHSFLEEASKMFDMYIYTMGIRGYALRMAKFLDPQGVYFENKVISREHCREPNQKGLDIVLAEESTVLILDDNKSVWARNQENLILVERYEFFCTNRSTCHSKICLSESMEDESESDGELSLALDYLKNVHESFFDTADVSLSDVRELL